MVSSLSSLELSRLYYILRVQAFFWFGWVAESSDRQRQTKIFTLGIPRESTVFKKTPQG